MEYGRNRINKSRMLTVLCILLMVFVCGQGAFAAAMTDTQISNAVDDEMIEENGVDADEITVNALDGIVTLNGTVDSILEKDRAEKIALTVKGVRSVVNKVTVSPVVYHTDTEIAEDVEDAFIYNPVTESWEITSRVKDGVVNLSGSVDSWQEKEIAAKVAKGVKGVKGIDNDITVEYEVERPDNEIEEEIEAALKWDILIDHGLLTVKVKNNDVTLSGYVGSAAEKNRAKAKAWVAGVNFVSADAVKVKWWARNDKLRKNKYTNKDDKSVKQAIKDAFLYDPRVNMFNVEVDVDNGVATLRGTVNNLKAKRAAADDARNTLNVWRVKNRIKIAGDLPSDEKVENDVEAALIADPYVERYELTVTVLDNEVYLSGDVTTQFEKAQAEFVASGITGVSEVHNNIQVSDGEALTYDPYYDYWNPDAFDWYEYPEFTVETDWEIRQDLNEIIEWSPYLESDEITVEVEDGKAILSGEVETWYDLRRASEAALEAGAVSVDNNLNVDYGPDDYEG